MKFFSFAALLCFLSAVASQKQLTIFKVDLGFQIHIEFRNPFEDVIPVAYVATIGDNLVLQKSLSLINIDETVSIEYFIPADTYKLLIVVTNGLHDYCKIDSKLIDKFTLTSVGSRLQ